MPVHVSVHELFEHFKIVRIIKNGTDHNLKTVHNKALDRSFGRFQDEFIRTVDEMVLLNRLVIRVYDPVLFNFMRLIIFEFQASISLFCSF
jgi:hypothetical protein